MMRQFSSYYIENGAYLKVENVNIGYTIPFKESPYIQKFIFILPQQTS